MKVKHKRLMWLIIFLWVLIPFNVMIFYSSITFTKVWLVSLFDLVIIGFFVFIIALINDHPYTLSKENDRFKNKSLEAINSILRKINID